jgi:hypothetical protein
MERNENSIKEKKVIIIYKVIGYYYNKAVKEIETESQTIAIATADIWLKQSNNDIKSMVQNECGVVVYSTF